MSVLPGFNSWIYIQQLGCPTNWSVSPAQSTPYRVFLPKMAIITNVFPVQVCRLFPQQPLDSHEEENDETAPEVIAPTECPTLLRDYRQSIRYSASPFHKRQKSVSFSNVIDHFIPPREQDSPELSTRKVQKSRASEQDGPKPHPHKLHLGPWPHPRLPAPPPTDFDTGVDPMNPFRSRHPSDEKTPTEPGMSSRSRFSSSSSRSEESNPPPPVSRVKALTQAFNNLTSSNKSTSRSVGKPDHRRRVSWTDRVRRSLSWSSKGSHKGTKEADEPNEGVKKGKAFLHTPPESRDSNAIANKERGVEAMKEVMEKEHGVESEGMKKAPEVESEAMKKGNEIELANSPPGSSRSSPIYLQPPRSSESLVPDNLAVHSAEEYIASIGGSSSPYGPPPPIPERNPARLSYSPQQTEGMGSKAKERLKREAGDLGRLSEAAAGGLIGMEIYSKEDRGDDSEPI
jgi:hypothetical protein